MRLKLCFLLVFIFTFSWAQTTKTFTTNDTFAVPAGVTSINAQAWGGGGSGGGASGAGIVFGRGAAGGGGGAYVSSTLSVSSGQVLNVEVATQTSGTSGANGTAGGFSTVSGYEASFLAAGGSGGEANNAGGTPAGGSGGLVSSSAGTIKFAGLNGVQGNTWSLLSLLLTSGAGGAGANFGGAGGAAVGSLILGTAPGNPGSAPGGGGSGAINSALGTAQIGGTGAAGQVIISYTCPAYNITGTTASNVCITGSGESLVSVVSSASSLPAGSYVVTYNRSNPAATGLSANMIVSPAGTGTFTATGFTAVGNSTIVITKITSESCSSTINANNSATIIISPTTVGGVVTGGTTINAGSTSGLLTLSGHTGSVVKWQSSVSPFTTWTDIANTNVTYTSGILNVTTQFRAVVQSGTCSAANSQATTVTIEDIPTIALASYTDNVCYDGSATTTLLPYKGTTGDPVTYSIVWSYDFDPYLVDVTDAVLPASPITIQIPAGIPADTYTGTLTVKNASGISSEGSVFTVTLETQPTLSVYDTTTPVCSNTDLQYTSLVYNSITGNPTSYYIDWDNTANAALLQDQPSTPLDVENEPFAIETIQVSANAEPGVYSGTFYLLNGSCSSSMPISLIIKPTPTAPVIESVTQPTSENQTGSVALSGLPVGNWILEVSSIAVPINGTGENFIVSGLDPGEYTFTVTKEGVDCPSEPSEIANINTIIWGRTASETKDSTENTILVSSLNKVINVNTHNQIIDKVYIFDVSGNLIYQKNGVSNSKLAIDNLRSGNQVLLVKVVLNNNEIETRKVVF